MQRSHLYGKPASSEPKAGINNNEVVAMNDSHRILEVLGDEFDDDPITVPANMKVKVESDAMNVDNSQKLIQASGGSRACSYEGI